jgi:glycosyltransferase involved in cell wall biosynthesis
MRILHVISSFAGGGAEIFVKDLGISLVQSGHDVAIAYISSAKDQNNDMAIENQFKAELAKASVSVFEIGHASRRNPFLGAMQLRKIVNSFRPDVLHVHLGQGLLYRTLMLRNIPTLYTHHNTIFRFGRLLTKWFDVFIERYIAICKSCEDLLKQRTHRPIHLIRNGISARRVADKNPLRGNGVFKVLSVGRISAQKNYDAIIEIAKILAVQPQRKQRDIRFQICGDGADLEVLQKTANEAGVGKFVQFLGGRSDVPELMAEADVLLMTSIYEGMPITLIEAAHAGLPLIATDVGGCSEIVIDGANGYLFTPNDHQKAADLIAKVWTDKVLWRKLGLASEHKSAEFGMTHVTEQHIGLYRTTIKKATHI